MALVFGLVILLILTILGVSALRTSSLEQLMAGGTQESTRALQAADSALSRALYTIQTSTATTDPSLYPNNTTYTYTGASAKVGAPTRIQICNNQQRSATGNAYGTTATAYYDQSVRANTPANANTVLHQGLTAPAAANPYNVEPCYQ